MITLIQIRTALAMGTLVELSDTNPNSDNCGATGRVGVMDDGGLEVRFPHTKSGDMEYYCFDEKFELRIDGGAWDFCEVPEVEDDEPLDDRQEREEMLMRAEEWHDSQARAWDGDFDDIYGGGYSEC